MARRHSSTSHSPLLLGRVDGVLQNQTRPGERQLEAVEEHGAVLLLGAQLLVHPYPEPVLLLEAKPVQIGFLRLSQARGRHHERADLATAAATATAAAASLGEQKNLAALAAKVCRRGFTYRYVHTDLFYTLSRNRASHARGRAETSLDVNNKCCYIFEA